MTGLGPSGCCRLVLSDTLWTLGQMLNRLPRVGRGCVVQMPSDQVVRPAPDCASVETLLHNILLCLARVVDRTWQWTSILA